MTAKKRRGQQALSSKEVVIKVGGKIKAPLFTNEGDKIRIDTRTVFTRKGCDNLTSIIITRSRGDRVVIEN